MIDDFQTTLSLAWDLLGMEFTIYGFTMSFREVFLWSLVAALLLYFIGRIFNDD